MEGVDSRLFFPTTRSAKAGATLLARSLGVCGVDPECILLHDRAVMVRVPGDNERALANYFRFCDNYGVIPGVPMVEQ